jgi:hypothetical protein
MNDNIFNLSSVVMASKLKIIEILNRLADIVAFVKRGNISYSS